jgi:hypothetical protein
MEPDSRMFFHLAQEDVRSQFKPSVEYSIGIYLMSHDSTMTKKTNRTKAETLHTPTFINRCKVMLFSVFCICFKIIMVTDENTLFLSCFNRESTCWCHVRSIRDKWRGFTSPVIPR